MINTKKQILVGTEQHSVAKLLTFQDDGTAKIADIICDDNLVVIVSPPSAGKTLLGMGLANKLGGENAIYSSGELTTETIKERLIPAIAGKTLSELKQDPANGIVALSKLAHYKAPEVCECRTLDGALAVVASQLSGSEKKQVVFLDAYSRFKIEGANSRHHEQTLRMDTLKKFATDNNLLIITTEQCARSGVDPLSKLTPSSANQMSMQIDSLVIAEREMGESVIKTQLFIRS